MSNLKTSREGGFTLVELMVAMTIGLLLTVAIASLFVQSRRTYATTDDVSRMQENIRYAYYILNRTLHHAGYKSSPNTRTEDVFPAISPLVSGANGGTQDTLVVRYEGSGILGGAADGTIVDCLGAPVTAGQISVNTFSVSPGANGRNALFCSAGGVAATELVPDVESFQVLYGFDEDQDLVADHFDIFQPTKTMANVRAVRIAMLFSTATARVGEAALDKDSGGADVARVYKLNEASVTDPGDRRIRRPVVFTINLRNRAP